MKVQNVHVMSIFKSHVGVGTLTNLRVVTACRLPQLMFARDGFENPYICCAYFVQNILI